MAEAILSVAIDKTANLLGREVSVLSGVKEDVERLQADLKRMQSFLKDSDRQKDHDERLRNWVEEIRDIAYDSDDVIDAYLVKIPRRGVEFCGFRPSMLYKAPHLHAIHSQIEDIRNRIDDLCRSIHAFGYNVKFGDEAEASGTSASEMQRRLRRTDPDDEDEHIITLETTTNAVMEQLMNEEDQLRVVSIVGMGGLGKTTLAKKVYNRSDVKRHFDCKSWAFISQQFSLKDVCIGVLMDVSPGQDRPQLRSMNEEELVRRLKNMLKGERYLVILDDIWNGEAWDSLKQAFPKGKKGSKVLFTTRRREVALYADPRSSPVELPFLTDEQGWELLKRKACLEVSDETTKCYMSEFERLGKEMVRRCGGLPLAIAVLGSLLASKSVKEWEVVEADINAQFVKLQHTSRYAGVNWILALSYQDLPWRLKPCFLYLSQFPEDWEIRIKELIQMWVAEGFIPQGEGEGEMEDVGQGYIEELVSRSMIQVSQKGYTRTGMKTCRMHDLMRDMCLLKAKEDKFLGFMEYRQDSKRRIAVHRQHMESNSMIHLKECSQQLRSLLFSLSIQYDGSISRHDLIFMLKNFSLLRVVKLRDVTIEAGYIPKEIGNLIHLRYLGLWSYLGNLERSVCIPMLTLPASIGKLKNLYTLDVRGNDARIPDTLWKLVCLRHLFIDDIWLERSKLRLDTLTNLQTLKGVYAHNLIRNDALLKLTNLRDLAIICENKKEAEVILSSPIIESGRLRSLKMTVYRDDCFPNLDILLRCQLLTKLSLAGVIREDPKSPHESLKCLPENLVKLTLNGFGLEQDPMGILGKLPNLRFLGVVNQAYKGSKMVCSANCFLRLEILSLEYLWKIEEWEIEQGAMPCLNKLELISLENLKMIPEGLMWVTSLQDLSLVEMTEEFERRIKVIDRVEGEDFYKVRHIPSIRFRNFLREAIN